MSESKTKRVQTAEEMAQVKMIRASRKYMNELGPLLFRPDLFLILIKMAESERAAQFSGAEVSDLSFVLMSAEQQKLAALTRKSKKRGEKIKKAKYEQPPLIEQADVEAALSRAALVQ